jgi:hypothetical protein
MYLNKEGETAISRFVEYYKREFGSLRAFTETLFAWLDDLVGGFFSRNLKKMSEFFKPLSSIASGWHGSDSAQSLVRGYAGADAQFDSRGRLTSGTILPPSVPLGTNSVLAPVSITINAPAGMNTRDLAQQISDQWDAHVRQAAGGIF